MRRLPKRGSRVAKIGGGACCPGRFVPLDTDDQSCPGSGSSWLARGATSRRGCLKCLRTALAEKPCWKPESEDIDACLHRTSPNPFYRVAQRRHLLDRLKSASTI